MTEKLNETLEKFSNKRNILIREDLEYSAQKLFTYSAIGLTALGIYVANNEVISTTDLTKTVADLNGSLSALAPQNSETTKLITYTLVATAKIYRFMGIKDYLPDFKGALNNFYDERLKDTIENKSTEYKELAGEFIAKSLNYQKAMFAIAQQARPKPTKNPTAYYQCMSVCCQKGKKITQVARECKQNSPALIASRTKQVKELQKALTVVQKFAQSLETILANNY
ncbi:9141_t:CDS:2 [Entrophospora sp. SA101]|nr:9141_t:CDS:2 [Entrophospora sp. SA101]